MRIPEFVKEVVWALYPPRYRQLADKPFHKSLGYLSRLLLVAFLIAGVLFVPRLFTLKDTLESELGKFETFAMSGNVTQSAPVTVPKHNPWLVVDLNANLNLTKEIIVIDNQTVQYRFLGIKRLPREQLKNVASNRPGVSAFISAILLLMLPGIALLLYIRAWLKYLLIILVSATLFFIIMELTRFRLRWKQLANIATHALTAVVLIEVVSAPITTVYLLPKLRFLGVSIYLITLALFAVLMVVGIVGYHIEEHRRRR